MTANAEIEKPEDEIKAMLKQVIAGPLYDARSALSDIIKSGKTTNIDAHFWRHRICDVVDILDSLVDGGWRND